MKCEPTRHEDPSNFKIYHSSTPQWQILATLGRMVAGIQENRSAVAPASLGPGESLSPSTDVHRLNVVLCGSFRRDVDGLSRAYASLREQFEVLSPRSLNFVDATATFVRLPDEIGRDTREIEEAHLMAMTRADFVWLHAPDGYVGTSAALEIGHARAHGVPVYSSSAPRDEMLASYVRVVAAPEDVPAVLEVEPGRGLRALQAHYERAAVRRGWDGETATDTMLLLTEEIGELARAVRKNSALSRHHEYGPADVADELADVQLYLVHLANILDVDIASAVSAKERVNARRAERAPDASIGASA